CGRRAEWCGTTFRFMSLTLLMLEQATMCRRDTTHKLVVPCTPSWTRDSFRNSKTPKTWERSWPKVGNRQLEERYLLRVGWPSSMSHGALRCSSVPNKLESEHHLNYGAIDLQWHQKRTRRNVNTLWEAQ